MTDNNNETRTGMNEEEFREAVQMDVPSDAITVSQEGNTTTVELFYHEPETRIIPMGNSTEFGILLSVEKVNGEKLMSEVIEDIQLSSSPNNWEIEDKNGFYVVTLTYEDGREW